MIKGNQEHAKIIEQIDCLLGKDNVVGILLLGSRSRNTHQESSDWDLLIFVNHKKDVPACIEWHTVYLDMDQITLQEWNHRRDAFNCRKFPSPVIIHDPQGILTRQIIHVWDDFNITRSLTEPDRYNRKVFWHKSIMQLKRHEQNRYRRMLVLGKMRSRVVRYWFEIVRNEWEPDQDTAWEIIQKEDHDFFILLQNFFQESDIYKLIVVAEDIEKYFLYYLGSI